MTSFPNLVLGQQTFSGCTSLQEATTPQKYTKMNNYPFDGCSSMTKLRMPNVTSIEYAGLRIPCGDGHCILYLPTAFTTFANYWNYNNNKYTLIMSSEIVLASNPGAGAYAVYVPDVAVDAYKAAWSSIASKIHPMSEFEG